MLKRNGVASLPSGGAKHVKVDNEMREELADIIGEYPTMSLKEINNTLHNRLPEKPRISDDCITKTLDGMLFSLKKVHNVHNS